MSSILKHTVGSQLKEPDGSRCPGKPSIGFAIQSRTQWPDGCPKGIICVNLLAVSRNDPTASLPSGEESLAKHAFRNLLARNLILPVFDQLLEGFHSILLNFYSFSQ